MLIKNTKSAVQTDITDGNILTDITVSNNRLQIHVQHITKWLHTYFSNDIHYNAVFAVH